MADEGQQVGLHELGLRQGRSDFQERLTCEDEPSFGHGADLAVERQAVQRFQVLGRTTQ